MLDNYAKNEDGIVYQVNREPFDYGGDYVNDRYGPVGIAIRFTTHLRLGLIIGSIGHIPESLLDVGYGNGGFLHTAKEIVPNLYGYDIVKTQGLCPSIEVVEDMTSRHYEVITFFDSLEHIPDIEFMKDLDCDYVVISLPWYHEDFGDYWFETWKHRKPDEHLWHFSDKSLVKFMTRMGYDTVSITNTEDTTRNNYEPYENILTGVFKKIK